MTISFPLKPFRLIRATVLIKTLARNRLGGKSKTQGSEDRERLTAQ